VLQYCNMEQSAQLSTSELSMSLLAWQDCQQAAYVLVSPPVRLLARTPTIHRAVAARLHMCWHHPSGRCCKHAQQDPLWRLHAISIDSTQNAAAFPSFSLDASAGTAADITLVARRPAQIRLAA
jgi:hypothetical protein